MAFFSDEFINSKFIQRWVFFRLLPSSSLDVVISDNRFDGVMFGNKTSSISNEKPGRKTVSCFLIKNSFISSNLSLLILHANGQK